MARNVPALKSALLWLHKWLGVALVLLFLMWFASGVVLYFVPFPNTGQIERLAALPALPADGKPLLTPAQAAGPSGLAFTQARLGMHDGRPVWRLLAGSPPVWHAVDARDGTPVPPLDAAGATRVAEAFGGRPGRSVEMLARDQWTVPQGLDPYRPLFKVALDGDDGLELYVSAGAAEVVRDTRRAERFWNWLGAVPHWIYPTVLRQFPQAWNQTVVGLSIPGVVLAASGLVLGVWQLFLNRSRWIPYRRFWMRWHHIAGLAAGLVTLTWIFSGLMSMNPYGVFSPRGETVAERAVWTGAASPAALDPAQALRMGASAGLRAREVEAVSVDGRSWYRLRDVGGQRWVAAAETGEAGEGPPAARRVETKLPDALMQSLLTRLRPAAGPPRLALVDRYDDQYYSRDPSNAETPVLRPLPVWRAQYPDAVVVYADAASGRILLRVDASRRWQRVLYHGLHSFDFAPLMARPWLRHCLVVGLSVLGMALCLTSLAIAWRVLVPRKAAGRP